MLLVDHGPTLGKSFNTRGALGNGNGQKDTSYSIYHYTVG